MIAFLTTLMLPALLLGNQEVSLKHTPKVGIVGTYSSTLQFSSEKFKGKVTTRYEEKVLSAFADGSYVVEDHTLEYKFNQDGKISDGPDMSLTTQYNAEGHVMTLEGAQKITEESYRYCNLSLLIWPGSSIKPGADWGFEMAASPTSGGVAISGKYTFVGFEDMIGVKALKVMFAISEPGPTTSARSVGIVWIDPADGHLLRREAQLKNVPIDGEVYDVTIKTLIEKPPQA